MKSTVRRWAVPAALLAIVSVTAAATVPNDGPFFHERKEVAGLAVVFGAEPEPAITDEVQFLRWRVSTLAEEEPYGDFADAEVMITKDGDEFGPFPVRGVRGSPGQYQTRHIFTAVGEYGSVLSFKKGEESEVHSVDFNFNINDRGMMEIPRRRGGS